MGDDGKQAAPGATPRHVAIIMDGNGRWAQARGRPRQAGHKAGVDSVRAVLEACAKHQVTCLTLFAFSSENWKRPGTEVKLLMQLFQRTLEREARRLHKNGIRLRFIGDRARFSAPLRQAMDEAEALTRGNEGLYLNIAVSYGGRWDAATAARRIAERVARGELTPEQVDETLFAREVSLADLPEPDLFIRTGGERRISNFLLWQLAYTELYFTDRLWPDFREQAFEAALQDFRCRQRRFGLTSEQLVETEQHA
ncbi:polyprenyl diphosphate synthase [Alkalilimnicola sp. S0819]|uniref:polyprenyl diphosphate synthase n=1 Tax=Alkalilimnicola sp. S0819 TaxID=2613922 RepID=UPI00126258E9|nr:polyprenyl diphosphate synthase [Alkalilimnicola sp. S0819]KAB7627920.1 di-trans,poly-cis-decaprenylcistransferase [Alkalilimnicola sp. S0819]MPQ15556.1 di-trans,poly-cis-decaprenylcistransferase [Alkalilimnicola sp. S0819]